LSANGGGSGGNGGTVNVTIALSSTAIDVTNAKLEAKADFGSNLNGKGGNISINNAKGTVTGNVSAINYWNVFRVDGSSDNGVTDMGELTINSVTCHQWKTNAAIYPKVAWDCVTPSTGATIPTLVAAGASLSPTLQSRLATTIAPAPAAPRIGVFAFPSLVEHEKFFGRPASGIYDNQFGISFVSDLRVSSTFVQSNGISNASLSGSQTIMVAALVHELGHNLDFIWGPYNPQSTYYSLDPTNSWYNTISTEFASMNQKPCTSVFYATTCTAYPTLSNEQIFITRFSGIGNSKFELFGAMFEHMQSVLTGNPPSYQVDPELEKALDSMVYLKAIMSNLIANPPPSIK